MGPTQLKAFRRYQVPVHAGTVTTVLSVVTPRGHSIVSLDLPAFRRRPAPIRFGTVAGGATQSTPQPLYGHSIVSLDLRTFRRRQAPIRLGTVAGGTAPSTPLYGWLVEPTILRSRKRSSSTESIDRIGPSAVAPPRGCSIVSLDLPAFRRRQVPVHAGTVTSGTATSTPQPLYGWFVESLTLRSKKYSTSTESIDRVGPPAAVAPARGHSIVSLDLPTFRRRQVPVHIGARTSSSSSPPPPAPFVWFVTVVNQLRRATCNFGALGQKIGFGSFASTAPLDRFVFQSDLTSRRLRQVPHHAGVVRS